MQFESKQKEENKENIIYKPNPSSLINISVLYKTTYYNQEYFMENFKVGDQMVFSDFLTASSEN